VRPVGVGIFLRQQRADAVHVGPRALDGHARLHARKDLEGVIRSRWRRGPAGERHWHPELDRRLREFEVGWQHADDLVRHVVQGDLAADRLGVAGEPRLPQRVAENDHLVQSRRGLLSAERAAEGRLDAQDVEERR
jgi:hypothetical protein